MAPPCHARRLRHMLDGHPLAPAFVAKTGDVQLSNVLLSPISQIFKTKCSQCHVAEKVRMHAAADWMANNVERTAAAPISRLNHGEARPRSLCLCPDAGWRPQAGAKLGGPLWAAVR